MRANRFRDSEDYLSVPSFNVPLRTGCLHLHRVARP
jgi:hypothetical protein